MADFGTEWRKAQQTIDYQPHVDEHDLLSETIADLVFDVNNYSGTAQQKYDLAYADAIVSGGTIFFPPGSYAAQLVVDDNVKLRISGYGATLAPASGTAIRVSQGNGADILGCTVEGFTIDGAAGDITGIKAQDTDGSVFRDLYIKNIRKGIVLHNTVLTTTWCERNVFTNILLESDANAASVAITFDPTGSVTQNSFAESSFRDVFATGFPVGIDIESAANVYRSRMHNVVLWLGNTGIGMKVAGNVKGSFWDVSFEALAATPTAGIQVLSGAVNTDLLFLRADFTGTFTANVTTYDTAVPLMWWDGIHLIEVGDGRGLRYRPLTSAFDVLQFAAGFAGGGGIILGGGSGAPDISIHRIGADHWGTADQFSLVGPLPLGYGTGAGGAVTQQTNSATAVTLDKPCGQITTVALTTAAAAEEAFVCNNSLVDANDVVVVNTTYAGAGKPLVFITNAGAGVFTVNITNVHADALNAVLIINFALIKSATS